uniref:Ig-like domain-containing protein n=1 Tax=Astyanax mexicanus TaxID=7994 RepID=A0A3B1IT44_ASTMX
MKRNISSIELYFLSTERPTAVASITPDNQVFRGDAVTLRCSIQGGGEIEWRYSWSKVGQSYPYRTTQEIRIISVTESHSGDYSCSGTVKRTQRYSHTSNSVSLTVSGEYLPTASLTVDPDSIVFTGESVTLKCEITGYYGWRYQWFYKKNNWYDWAAVPHQYRCRGERSNQPTSSQNSTTVTLTVNKTPEPELTSSLKGAALIGNPVTLYCNLKQSAGWRFYWFKHTQTPESETTTDTHSSYTIRPVNVSDGGQYWCRAGRGDPVYYTHYSDMCVYCLTFTVKPHLSVQPDLPQIFRGENTVTLTCDIKGHTDTEWRYSWYKDDPVYYSEGKKEYSLSVVESDSGEYTCRGERRSDSQRSEISDAVTLTVSGEFLGLFVNKLTLYYLFNNVQSLSPPTGKTQNTNQTQSDQNRRGSGAEDSQDGYTPLQAGQTNLNEFVVIIYFFNF